MPATTPIGSAPVPLSGGPFRPEQALTGAGQGTALNGTWQLEVRDLATGNTGSLRRWSLSFERPLTYAWTGPNNFSSTAQNPTVTPPGTSGLHQYLVTVTDPATGCSRNGGAMVAVQQPVLAPTATPSTACAATDVVQLNANLSGTVPYEFTQTRNLVVPQARAATSRRCSCRGCRLRCSAGPGPCASG
jgi:hypothetical protein